jgi:eukaryotic-like serine/threonine-protein kinase
MSKLPPLPPPLPPEPAPSHLGGAVPRKGNGQNEAIELIEDVDLMELVEEAGSDEKTPARTHPDIDAAALAAPPKSDVLSSIGGGKTKRKKKEETGQTVVAGRSFGRFELLLEMGSGGMATLFLSRIRGPQNFEKLIAIKKIHDHLSKEEEFVDMFLDEARISAMIHHPNVVQIFDLGSIDDVYFIAMEYVHGQDLSQILRGVIRSKNQTFTWTHAVRLVADACSGLHAAHELKDQEGDPLGLVHRDVSPQNILVSYDGHLKVVDFGIAFAAEKISQTSVGTLKGKASYMSPEQSRGQPVDRRSDVFALGILLFECCCMKRLFREENEAATLLRVGAADVPRPRSVRPELPAELERIILRALAKKREDRFESAGDMAQALEKLLVSRGEVVGPAQIETLMSELFHDRKRIRDSQLREVSLRPSTHVGPAIGVSTTTVTQLAGLDGGETGPPTRGWVLPVVVGLVAMVVLALVVVILYPQFMGEKPSNSATARTVPTPAPMPPPMQVVVIKPPEVKKADKVLLEITVLPAKAKATILFRGKEYRQNALELLVVPTNTSEVVRVEAPGFHSLTKHVTVNAKAKLKHEIKLKRKAGRITRPYRPHRPRMGPDDDLKGLPGD